MHGISTANKGNFISDMKDRNYMQPVSITLISFPYIGRHDDTLPVKLFGATCGGVVQNGDRTKWVLSWLPIS